MRLLLDTHILLWWLQDHPHLSKPARDRIAAAAEVYVSSVSIWGAGIEVAQENLTSILRNLLPQYPIMAFWS